MNNLIKYLSQIKKIIKEKYLCDIKIKIETINNPGWSIKIKLYDLIKRKILIPTLALFKRKENDWIEVSKNSKDDESILLLGGPKIYVIS